MDDSLKSNQYFVTTGMAISGIASMFSKYADASVARSEGRAAKKQSQAEAILYKMSAGRALREAAQKQAFARRKANLEIGKQITGTTGNGVDINSGSALAALVNSETEAAREQAMIEMEGFSVANDAMLQGRMSKLQGDLANSMGKLSYKSGIAGMVATGAASIYEISQYLNRPTAKTEGDNPLLAQGQKPASSRSKYTLLDESFNLPTFE